ncbi:MAG: pilus assembly protein N-terminal domain-containing protein [Thermodesulfobacteriota bacterium]|nr:pilus assembly protein N-terminal domain-containing protein [Thermodesulfobacteriota bacterium]
MIKVNRAGQTECTHPSSTRLPAWLYVLFMGLLLAPSTALAGMQSLDMYVGEVKVLEINNIERVAIGNPGVASNSILPQGQLVLLADSEGVTRMHIWLKDGSERDFEITVQQKRTLDSYQELVHLLADIPGIKAQKVGEVTVVKGTIAPKDKNHYNRIMTRYSNVLDLVKTSDTTTDIERLLKDIPGISVDEVGGAPVLSGEVSSEFAQVIKVVKQKYPSLMNLTRIHEAVAGKMVYMKVRIMEMNRSITENLGINWNVMQGIAGPSFEFGIESTTDNDDASILNNTQQGSVPGSLAAAGKNSITNPVGYFGIATGVSSILNIYEGTGDAIVLAEPRLSTRSGGSAEFLAGGEYPVPTSNSMGATNVEFKKYGIQLNVQPTVDDTGNILAHIETEISTIDEGNAVNGIPGILTRRTNTDVSLKAKQTLVIAGLVKDVAHKNYSQVKWLGEIPLLGKLFKSKAFQNKQTELVIFITPFIYDAASELNRKELERSEAIDEEFARIIEGESILE